MKHFALVALLGLVQASAVEEFYYRPEYVQQQGSSSSSSSGSSSSSSDEDVQLGSSVTFTPTYDKPEDYPAYMNGFGGYRTYVRDTPDRFESEADDTLMRSMYDTYATEGMDKAGLPDGRFWVTEANAKKAAAEIVGTHLHLLGDEQKSFVNEVFPAAWARYDVNEEGKIELDRMPIFLRHICGNTEACLGMQ